LRDCTTLELFNINRFYNGDFKIAFDQQKIRFTDSVAVADPAWDTLLAIAPVEGDTLILAITRVGMESDLVPDGVHSLLNLQFEALSSGATELHLVVDIIEDREGAISELPNLYIDDQWLTISGTVDQTPPAKITNLSVTDLSTTSVTLSWTATGDDGNIGNLSGQEVAYSTDSLSVANWAGLSPLTITDLVEPGSQQTFTVSDLASGVNYFFAVRAGDEADNWSPVSNIVSATPTQILIVDIPDPVLEYLIRAILDKSEGDILASEMATITQIIGGGVSDLTGLQYCVNLVHLVLDTSAVSTLVPVIGLNKLERLHITKGLLSDLTPLSNLSNLILLNLSEHSISDITPLSGLGTLEQLYLDMNSIEDIGALVNLSNLSRVSLQNNQISDIQPLVNNSGIGSGDIIWLNGNPLSTTSSRERIPLLEERGVTVHHDTDTTSPAPINDFSVVDNTENSLTFQWTATGDDGNLGTASQYDMRYALNLDTIFTWSSATQVTGEPTPQPAGSIEIFTVGGLEPEVTYFFGLLAADEAGNWSALEIVLEVTIVLQSPRENDNRLGALVRRLNTGDCLTNDKVKTNFIERMN